MGEVGPGIIKYCPWCGFRSLHLDKVIDHKKTEHDFLEGVMPPRDPRFDIHPPTEDFSL